MTNSMKRNPRGGRGPRTVLYALGILVAIMAAVLVKTTVIDNTGLSKVNLTSFNPLTVAPIANQSSDTGMPVYPISPTATDSQTLAVPGHHLDRRRTAPGHHHLAHVGPDHRHPETGRHLPGHRDRPRTTPTRRPSAPRPSTGTSATWHRRSTRSSPSISAGAGGIRVVITGRNFVDATVGRLRHRPGRRHHRQRQGHQDRRPSHRRESAGTVDIRVTAIGAPARSPRRPVHLPGRRASPWCRTPWTDQGRHPGAAVGHRRSPERPRSRSVESPPPTSRSATRAPCWWPWRRPAATVRCRSWSSLRVVPQRPGAAGSPTSYLHRGRRERTAEAPGPRRPVGRAEFRSGIRRSQRPAPAWAMCSGPPVPDRRHRSRRSSWRPARRRRPPVLSDGRALCGPGCRRRTRVWSTSAPPPVSPSASAGAVVPRPRHTAPRRWDRCNASLLWS